MKTSSTNSNEQNVGIGQKIGGLLYLVAIGMILNPALNFIHARQVLAIAADLGLSGITERDASSAAVLLFEIGMQVYMLIFSFIVSVFFFMRSSKFPRLFIIYIVSVFLLGIVGVFVLWNAPGTTPEIRIQALGFPLYIFVLGMIWIPYFLLSKRVRRTFVVGLSMTPARHDEGGTTEIDVEGKGEAASNESKQVGRRFQSVHHVVFIAVSAVVILLTTAGLYSVSENEKPSISASFDEMGLHGEDENLVFSFILVNNTSTDYRLPGGSWVELAGRTKDSGGLNFHQADDLFSIRYPVVVPALDKSYFTIVSNKSCAEYQRDSLADRGSDKRQAQECRNRLFGNLEEFVIFDNRNEVQIILPVP